MKTKTITAADQSGINQTIQVSAQDLDRIPPRGHRGSCAVTDQSTGEQVTLRRSSCGIPHCLCALDIVSRQAAAASSADPLF
jgi:hypothetical protein